MIDVKKGVVVFEEEATKYSNNWRILKSSKLNFAELAELRAVIYKANKDGAEFGYSKANEWHDLRKNPNDLPDTDRNVWVKRQSEKECQVDNYYEYEKGWGIMFREGWCTDDVILWCELPVLPKED